MRAPTRTAAAVTTVRPWPGSSPAWPKTPMWAGCSWWATSLTAAMPNSLTKISWKTSWLPASLWRPSSSAVTAAMPPASASASRKPAAWPNCAALSAVRKLTGANCALRSNAAIPTPRRAWQGTRSSAMSSTACAMPAVRPFSRKRPRSSAPKTSSPAALPMPASARPSLPACARWRKRPGPPARTSAASTPSPPISKPV